MFQKALTMAAAAFAVCICGSIPQVALGKSVSVPVDVDGVRGSTAAASASSTMSGGSKSVNFTKWSERRGPSAEEMEEERIARSERVRQRRARAREKFQKIQPDPSTLIRMSREELEKLNKAERDEDEHSWVRKAGWSWNNGVSGDYEPYGTNGMLDPAEEYDKWAQAYRMLGGYIDCDHSKSEGDSHDSGDNNNNGEEGDSVACSRWMIWAAYVNPNYQGNEYYEYFGDEPTSYLDCHDPNSEWELLGVYREEFYQYLEQISKHLWAIDEWEYVVALAGLAYMTDYDCFYVGQDNSGNYIYAGIAPLQGGKFRMGLYTDEYCIFENTNLGMTFDDFGLTSDVSLGSGDQGNNNGYGDDDVTDWWQSAQEYTFEDMNEVYDTFRYCTSCVDWPTYQDGYFIGDYGTDDDDLINQCWKFWSHDSFVCDADCLGKAHAQGTILSVSYGGVTWGETPSSFYSSSGESSSAHQESKFNRLISNIFLTLSFIVFVATFLAFAVARRSRHRERKNSKSRRLLDEDGRKSSSRRRRHKSESGDGVFRSKSSRRSSSRGKEEEGDGVYRSERRRSRSGHKRSSSRRSKSGSRRRVEAPEGDAGEYKPPASPDTAGDGTEEVPVGGGEERRKSSRRTASRRDDEF